MAILIVDSIKRQYRFCVCITNLRFYQKANAVLLTKAEQHTPGPLKYVETVFECGQLICTAMNCGVSCVCACLIYAIIIIHIEIIYIFSSFLAYSGCLSGRFIRIVCRVVIPCVFFLFCFLYFGNKTTTTMTHPNLDTASTHMNISYVLCIIFFLQK